MSSPVELIKERLSVTDVIGSYVQLEKAGSNLKAKCPFHNEKTPSFFVSPARGSYYCFGCGAKGDIFSFVQAFEGLDFMGALKSLGTRAGVEISPEDPKVRSGRERLFLLLETATAFFEAELNKNKEARAYLTKRGLSDETVRSWRIGFAEDEWQSCLDYCTTKGFSLDELEKAGLIKREGGKTYDRFRSRVMFPIVDASGRPVAFSGRLFGKKDDKAPKYLNSPETLVFSKSRILYGFDRAKNEIRRLDYTMLVEGQMDLLMCHQAGFKNAVASSGTSFTEEQITILKRLSKRLLMVYDADKAGVAASVRSASLALAEGMEVKVAALPEGKDPAELIVLDKEGFKQALKSSQHVIDFYLEAILKEGLDERSLLGALRIKLFPYIAALESSVERDYFIKRLAEKTGIREAAIREDLSSVEVVRETKEMVRPSVSLSPRRNFSERLLVGIWLWQSGQKEPQLDVATFRKEVERILGTKKGGEIFEEAKQVSDELVYQAESYYGGTRDLGRAVDELLSMLEDDFLSDEMTTTLHELALAKQKKDIQEAHSLQTTYQKLARRRDELRGKR